MTGTVALVALTGQATLQPLLSRYIRSRPLGEGEVRPLNSAVVLATDGLKALLCLAIILLQEKSPVKFTTPAPDDLVEEGWEFGGW